MLSVNEVEIATPQLKKQVVNDCYHCGAQCLTSKISIEDKYFCCEGCKLVYEILNEGGLCDYYKLQSHPGLSQIKAVRSDKYSYLDNEEITGKLYRFSSGDLAIVTLYIPSIHCSSCMWLLEHLSRLDSGVKESRLDFGAKEVTIHFSTTKTSLRKLVELLATIGYEPYISLDDTNVKAARSLNKKRVIKLGVAGFCFGNIMMMSFPEYLSGDSGIDAQYAHLFRYLNLFLALPVFFYSASEFFIAAWLGLKQRMLNIDAPIVLAIIITFSRSIFEIVTDTGAGYLDSMAGIVFFMLVGRVVQEQTYKSLSFTRDYKAYFPIAVNVRTESGVVSRQLSELKKNDIVILHHDEIIPADAVVLNDNANIDYSFVSGESEPVRVLKNSAVYAGGRQKGEELIIKIVKPIAASYLTSLWNHYSFKKDKAASNDRNSVIHILSRYFTIILFSLALGTAIYWYFNDATKIIDSVSAMLIVACPCALLLSATFTNSNILRIFGANGLYLRDATVIEEIAKTNEIVFDKTGTLTQANCESITFLGHTPDDGEKDLLYSVVKNSNHPNSVALASWLGERKLVPMDSWNEIPGKGLAAQAGGKIILVGSGSFTGVAEAESEDKATLYVKIDDRVTSYHLLPALRPNVPGVIDALGERYGLTVLSGDNDRQASLLQKVFGNSGRLLFRQTPADKLAYIEGVQREGKSVMMIGDGLNDAGALQQSNVGITMADDVNNFTPACDAILKAKSLPLLPAIMELAKYSATVIRIAFVASIIYNVIGLFFAMRGALQPVAAAILMPCSTLSIVIISAGFSNWAAWRKGLNVKTH